ncbi:Thioredoxin-related transmembrane protein 2 [Phytophthora citrophthora]|uniref:Thioredoxin-related transmembrane protein 2 n=1 Tax=Phytophthora citrophthora TaxID=4793 RepID=A0AAD9G453_9STRA|nr:Thioredoxin-related transmembrane protein 2 [Phytophthora citrophthora]
MYRGTDAEALAASSRMWQRFLAPYYVCNTIALLMYVPIRYQQSSEALLERENFFNLPLEIEIFLLALGSWMLNYRKKATADGVIALFFMYGKIAVLASLYYLDITLFGWYAVVCLVLFAAVGQPKYEGPTKITELDPAAVEKLVKKSSGSKKKGPANSWLVFYYTDWSDSCVEHEPMLADLSMLVDVNKWSDLAVESRINVSTSSWQLPTLILFQDGKEAMRLPPIDDSGKVTKTVLDRAGLIAVFKLQELKDGKSAVFKPKTS